MIPAVSRTVPPFMAVAGINTPTIQKALGHKSMAAASIYHRVNNDPVKHGFDIAIQTIHRYASAGSKNNDDGAKLTCVER